MNKTNTLLAELRATNPNLTFEAAHKAETAYADDEEYADELVGVVVDDVLIVDPTTSSCGRFDVDSAAEYGIPKVVCDAIIQNNKPDGLADRSAPTA